MPFKRVSRIPRPVRMLGIVSFLTDMSSEMIYPLLPVFLSGTLGAGPLVIGTVEGVAESTASLLKVASGFWADKSGKRKPMVLFGYGLAGFVRPLIGLAVSWPFVLTCRFLDRIGKGVRTAPRDALIADAVPPALRGEAYGFQRMMDHAGAVAGPLTAAALLGLAGCSMRAVFLLAAIPAMAVLPVILFGVHEAAPPVAADRPQAAPTTRGFRVGRDFRAFLFAVSLFTLGNATDAFILLRLSGAGVPAMWISLLWSAQHMVKSSVSYLGGVLSDKWGPRRTVIAGWILYAASYFGFAFAESPAFLIAVFLAYGGYFGLAEPAERAWCAEMAPPKSRGTHMGLFHGAVGVTALPASLLFGALWNTLGVSAAFAASAALALTAACAAMRVRGDQGDRDAGPSAD